MFLKKININSRINHILDYHYKYYDKYKNISEKIYNIKKPLNLNKKYSFIKKHKLGLMNIGKIKSINRVFFEMKKFLKAIKKFEIK